MDFLSTTKDLINLTLQHYLTGELCAIDKGRLPVVIEGGIRFIDDQSVKVGSVIFQTKALIVFIFEENPISELIKMFEIVDSRERLLWREISKETILSLQQVKDGNPESMFNHSYRIIEFARRFQLLAPQFS